MAPPMLDLLEPLMCHQGFDPRGLQLLVGVSDRLVVRQFPSRVLQGLRLLWGVTAGSGVHGELEKMRKILPQKVKDNFFAELR